MDVLTLEAGSGIYILPSGLNMVIESIDCHDALAGTITITNSKVNITYDGYNPDLSLLITENINLLITGTYTNISYRLIGDQHSYRVMDQNIKPLAAGFYPGHWGTGIGSIPRNGPNSYTESGGSGWYPH